MGGIEARDLRALLLGALAGAGIATLLADRPVPAARSAPPVQPSVQQPIQPPEVPIHAPDPCRVDAELLRRLG